MSCSSDVGCGDDERDAADHALLPVYPLIGHIVLHTRHIDQRVKDMARQISAEYHGKPLLVIGVLKGAFLFMADLCKYLTIPHEVDFVALSSYGAGGSNRREVVLRMDLRVPVDGKDVLIVEDIIDTGHTLAKLHDMFHDRHASSVKTAVLCRKKENIQIAANIDYLGFDVPNEWLVGYGLDYAEKMRCLPFIASLDRSKCT